MSHSKPYIIFHIALHDLSLLVPHWRVSQHNPLGTRRCCDSTSQQRRVPGGNPRDEGQCIILYHLVLTITISDRVCGYKSPLLYFIQQWLPNKKVIHCQNHEKTASINIMIVPVHIWMHKLDLYACIWYHAVTGEECDRFCASYLMIWRNTR